MNLNTSSETKAAYKVLYLIFMMMMYIHIVGCLWYQLTSVEEEWVPNMEFIFFGSAQIYNYYITKWLSSYMTGLYIGFYLFGVGEVCPRTSLELIITVIILITSSILNGLIIGNMALYMQELRRKTSQF